MIKCEVVFDGMFIKINGYVITFGERVHLYKGNTFLAEPKNIEEAIQYCMEQSND